MVFSSLAEHDQVIQADQCKAFLNLLLHDLIHAGLECCWCITQTETEHSELIMPKRCTESGLRFILRKDSYLMIAREEVEVAEDCRPSKLV